MKPPKPCLTSRCPEYTVPGKSRCARHETEFEAGRQADPALTGRRGSSSAWNRARGLALWRYDRKCAQCGRSDKEIELGGGRLEVDHIDNDATNHAQGNLEPLCSGCHREKHLSVAR